MVINTSGDFAYDCAVRHCSAIWNSEKDRLRCDDTTVPDDGFVHLLNSHELENRSENEPILGWVEGVYPAYTVQYGNTFKALVGCMAKYDLRSETIKSAYEDKNGRNYKFDEYQETDNQEVTKITLNLSDLASEIVIFILGMEANTRNVEDAQGFWFGSRIERHAGGGR